MITSHFKQFRSMPTKNYS